MPEIGMQRRNPTLLLLALLLAGVAGWSWWNANTDSPVPPAPLVPSGSLSPPIAHDVPPVAQDPNTVPLPADAPRVVVAVRELEAFIAPPAPRVRALDPVTREPLVVDVLAGVGANPFEEGTRAGLALAAVQLGATRLLRQIGLERDSVAEVPIGPRTMVRGRIADARGHAIAGAKVSLGEVDADAALRAVETDADGNFELDTPAGAGVPFLVQAALHAWQWRAVTVLAQGDNSLDMALDDAGQLDVQLACEAHEIEAARVFVVLPGIVASELAQYPFFLQALSRGFAVDASGRAAPAGLPRVGTIGLVVQHPGVPLSAPQERKLTGARTAAVVPLSLTALTSGRIIDERGLPVPGAVLLVRPVARMRSAWSTLRLLPPWLDAVGCTLVFGDAQGVFLLGASPSTDRVLSIRAPGHVGRDLPFTDGLLASPIEVPSWGEGEPSLRLLPPRPGVRWASEWNLSGGLKLVHEADSEPLIAVPHPGRFEVTVTSYVGVTARGSRTQVLAVTGIVAVQAPKID
jgi:hypothetical protein